MCVCARAYVCVCASSTLSSCPTSGSWLHSALRAGEQAVRASVTHLVATGQERAASFVLSGTARTRQVHGRWSGRRGRRDLSRLIEFIIDLLLNHGGVSVVRISGETVSLSSPRERRGFHSDINPIRGPYAIVERVNWWDIFLHFRRKVEIYFQRLTGLYIFNSRFFISSDSFYGKVHVCAGDSDISTW